MMRSDTRCSCSRNNEQFPSRIEKFVTNVESLSPIYANGEEINIRFECAWHPNLIQAVHEVPTRLLVMASKQLHTVANVRLIVSRLYSHEMHPSI